MTDLERIEQLKKEIGGKLKKWYLKNIKYYGNQGYALDERHNVVGLNLDKFGLKQLPKSLSFFRPLKKLSLAYNNLTDVSGIEGLVNLTILNLDSNQLSSLSGLEGLKKLTKVILINNKIKQLPEAIVDLGMEIDVEKRRTFPEDKGIFLFGNPIESPPLEILKKGRKAIKTYFRSLETAAEALPLNEVKVMLVGDGGAGKTSLVKRLLGQKFDKNESQTHGINIDEWQLTDKDREITAHLWDFGGQQITHATHQFFLSKRSLYILVLDGRKDEEPEYWLKHIQSFGGDSPVLVVINKIDENPGFKVNRKFLMEKYKNIKGFFRLSCRTNEGCDTFSKALKETLLQIEIIKTTWASNWFKVKERLEHMKEHYISQKEYRDICSGRDITDKEGRDTLVQFLNDLGVILHFKDLNLKDTHVLEPRWVTEAVYKIINSKALAEQSGVLKLDCLENILEKKTDEDFDYPPDKYSFIIELMNKFELCYPLESAGDRDRVLIPDLLKKEEPSFEFDYDSALRFIIRYDFLPKSIMPRFIVRRHKDIKAGLQWRTGVVLEDTSTRSTAVVRADERERRVGIYVTGDGKRDFFSVIRKTFGDINASFEKIDAAELVPLPDSETINVEYAELVGYESAGRDEIFIGKLGKGYAVSALLDGIEKKEDRIEKIDQDKIRIDFRPVIEVNPQMAQITKVDVKQETNVSVDIDIKVDLPSFEESFHELKELLEEAAGEDPKLTGELKRIEDGMDRLSLESGKKEFNSPFKKVGRFLNKLGDENSDFNKVLRGTKKGVELAQKVGRTYNKFAQWLALPQVPEFFLGSAPAEKSKKPSQDVS